MLLHSPGERKRMDKIHNQDSG